jgi:hypothetical protein
MPDASNVLLFAASLVLALTGYPRRPQSISPMRRLGKAPPVTWHGECPRAKRRCTGRTGFCRLCPVISRTTCAAKFPFAPRTTYKFPFELIGPPQSCCCCMLQGADADVASEPRPPHVIPA